MKMKKMLVPIDLSEFSLEALELANSLASLYQAQVYLLHVIPIETPIGYPAVDHHSETILRDAGDFSVKLLDAMIEKKMNNSKKLVRVIRRGEPHLEIVRYAKDEGVDLIIMATHGRTGLARVFLGSVAEAVIRRSPVPVLAVKPRIVMEKLLKENDIREQLHLSQMRCEHTN